MFNKNDKQQFVVDPQSKLIAGRRQCPKSKTYMAPLDQKDSGRITKITCRDQVQKITISRSCRRRWSKRSRKRRRQSSGSKFFQVAVLGAEGEHVCTARNLKPVSHVKGNTVLVIDQARRHTMPMIGAATAIPLHPPGTQT
ncbi:hypothetical protein CDAR_57091 [Caerostris darwini]|uniref:Uncharacterized protein n=1 Tax=Caerostris darwini TaxID=1538125 RepID=A0AAV4WAG0_9ARAC|nr:hypothetical protein CDAR_57091 [Caerostris darwini]